VVTGTISAEAQTLNFTAHLSGANEVPGVVNGAGGTATISLNTATRVVTYRVDVYNMPSGTTAAHFHAGGPGVSGPVVVNVTVAAGISNDFAITGTATAADLVPRTAQGIGSWDDFIQALTLGQIYVNVHSAVNPGGEVRGQVVPAS
jgi:hypothetical protein